MRSWVCLALWGELLFYGGNKLFDPIHVLRCIVRFSISNVSMAFLNYHHLRYFHAIAREGSLTKAAEHLNLSQSALSAQRAAAQLRAKSRPAIV